jgi:hypothetical protein
MKTRRYTTQQVVAFKTNLKENNLNEAQFALENLQSAIDSFAAELEKAWATKETVKNIDSMDN